MRKAIFTKWNVKTINLFRVIIIPIAIIGQITLLFDLLFKGFFNEGLYSLPNGIWITNSFICICLFIFTFRQMAAELKSRKLDGDEN